jgi:hypothetical protein
MAVSRMSGDDDMRGILQFGDAAASECGVMIDDRSIVSCFKSICFVVECVVNMFRFVSNHIDERKKYTV